MTPSFQFHCRAKTAFGIAALEHLPFDLAGMDAGNPLVVLEEAALKTGVHKRLADAFMDSGTPLGVAPVPDSAPETLEQVFQVFTDKGFDSIIALGTGLAADMAKTLNLAASFGPDILKTPAGPDHVNRALHPLVYIPTCPGPFRDTAAEVRFRDAVHVSDFLMPDLVVISPDMMQFSKQETVTDSALGSLAVCCEAFVRSGNPPVRAYAALGISLIMENLLPMISDGEREMSRKERKIRLAKLAHAAVLAGYVLSSCPDLDIAAVADLARRTWGEQLKTVSQGSLMGAAVAQILSARYMENDWMGELLLPLTDPDTFASVPAGQRPAKALQTVRDLLNTLFAATCGQIPRRLEDLGMTREQADGILAEAPERETQRRDG